MSGSDSSNTRGIWSKLLIWVVVIVAGFFYLRAIDEKRMQERHLEGAAQTAETPPAGRGGRTEVDLLKAAPFESTPPPEAGPQSQSIASGDGQQLPPADGLATTQSGVSPVSGRGPADLASVRGPERDDLDAARAVEAEVAPRQAASDKDGKEEQPPALGGSPEPAAVESGPTGPQAPIEFSDASLSAEPSPVAPAVPLALPERARPFAPVAPSATVVAAEPVVPPPTASATPSTLAQPGPARLSTPTPPKPALPASAEPAASSPPEKGVEDQRARVMAEQKARPRRYWRQRRPYWEPGGWPRTGPRGPHGAYYPGYGPRYYRTWR